MTQEEAMKQLEKEFPNKERNKVIFNIRTSEYTYFGKDGKQYKLSLKSKYLKGNSKEDILNEILDNHEIDPTEPKAINKIDIHLYQMLKYIDSKEHTSKADDYIEAFLDENPKKMPVDLVYDLKNKSKDNNEVKKLKFADKMRLKSIARRHEKLGLAECVRDKSIFRKILLGLGVIGTVGAIGAGATKLYTISKDNTNIQNDKGDTNEKDELTATPTPTITATPKITPTITATPTPTITSKENSKPKDNTNEPKEEETKENTNETQRQQIKNFMKNFKETNLISVNKGVEYTNASDLNEIKGKFVEDMDCEITNRAIVQKLSDGTEKIVATTKGKTWEEAGIDVSKYNSSEYVEKYALEAIGERKDSRGFSVFGWVDAKDCDKIYEFTQNNNGKISKTYHTYDNVREIVAKKFNLDDKTKNPSVKTQTQKETKSEELER